MADNDFPDSYETKTTTTTTTSSTTVCTYNVAYLRTLGGYLRIAQIGVGLIYWICIAATYAFFYGQGFLLFITVFSWFFTIILFVLYLFMIVDKITMINWPLTEFINNAIWGVLHVIGAILILVRVFKGHTVFGIWLALVLSFVISGLYLFHAFLGVKSGVIAFRSQSGGATVET